MMNQRFKASLMTSLTVIFLIWQSALTVSQAGSDPKLIEAAKQEGRLFRGYKRIVEHPEEYKNFSETLRLYQEIFKLR